MSGYPLKTGACATPALAHRVGVVELGTNHPGEIALLAQLTLPQVALINNAQREHQEFLHGLDAVARENSAAVAARVRHPQFLRRGPEARTLSCVTAANDGDGDMTTSCLARR